MSNKPEAMDEDEYRANVQALFSNAEEYYRNDIEPEQLEAIKFYNGDAFGTEEEGRSQFVVRTAHDVVKAILPSMLRTFDGPEESMEVVPWDEQEVHLATEMTDGANYISQTKNNGFRILHDAIKDALILKTGCLTWGAQTRPKPVIKTYTGWDRAMIDAIKAEGAEIVEEIEEEDDEDDITSYQADPNTPENDPLIVRALTGTSKEEKPEALKTYRVKVKRIVKDTVYKVAAFPPDQLRISRNARCEDTAMLIGRCRPDMTVGELVAMNFDFDEIIENAGPNSSASNGSGLADYRDPSGTLSYADTNDPSHQRVMFTEAWVRVDRDGDGIPELRFVRTLGDHHYILSDVEWYDDEAPIAILCPDPEPHQAIGKSVVDSVADLQLINSHVVRNMSDSMANAIHSRTAVDSRTVNMDDVTNTENGAIIRTEGPPSNAIMELGKSFIGDQALNVLGYFDAQRARRTGITDGSQGLNGDELQSTSAIGISAQLSAAQESLEMISRIFAETGLKRMYRGIIRMLIRHANGPLRIRTRDGSNRQVDPTLWNAEADIVVNTGLGKGSATQKTAVLNQILSLQMQAISQFGTQQPVVTVPLIRNTIEDLCKVNGKRDVSRHFGQVPPGWAPPEPPQPVDPNQALMIQAQAAQMKAQADMEKVKLEGEREMERMRLEFEFKHAQLAQEGELKRAEIEARFGADIQKAELHANQKQVAAETDSFFKHVIATTGPNGVEEPQPKPEQMPPPEMMMPPPGMMPEGPPNV